MDRDGIVMGSLATPGTFDFGPMCQLLERVWGAEAPWASFGGLWSGRPPS